jgi:hypothetical protein
LANCATGCGDRIISNGFLPEEFCHEWACPLAAQEQLPTLVNQVAGTTEIKGKTLVVETTSLKNLRERMSLNEYGLQQRLYVHVIVEEPSPA